MVVGSREQDQKSFEEEEQEPVQDRVSLQQQSAGEEVSGKLAPSPTHDKLMRSVLENDKNVIEQGVIITQGVNQGLQSFTPDLLFEHLVRDYKNAKNLFGPKLIRALSGYDDSAVERNIRIPEFQRELKERLNTKVSELRDQGLIDKDGGFTEEGLLLSTLTVVSEELDRLMTKGLLGEHVSKARALEGLRADSRAYRSTDRYKDVLVKSSAKKALRRGHTTILRDDLVVSEYEQGQRATIVYAIDASGSMRGEKIGAAKRAGIALSYKALRNHDLVGCLVFGKEVVAEHPPTQHFLPLVRTMMRASASSETNIALTIDHAVNMFESHKGVKHLLLLTDGLHTVGSDAQVLESAARAKSLGVTMSVVGLRISADGERLCKRLVEIGGGALYVVKNYDELDVVFIEEYYRVRRR